MGILLLAIFQRDLHLLDGFDNAIRFTGQLVFLAVILISLLGFPLQIGCLRCDLPKVIV